MLLPVAVTALSVVTVVVSQAADPQTKCFGDLGCFSTFQQLPLPISPEQIGAQFRLYTHSNPSDALIINATEPSQWGHLVQASHFDPHKDTKFIIHGWNDRSDTRWNRQMREELLKKGDLNVFNLDWRNGASRMLDVASANVFVVAAQLAKFLKFLHDSHGVDLGRVHLIGHSLGAHISGQTGSLTDGLGRVSGMDPAEPLFIDFDSSRRLDKTDAIFVDVIHSDAEKFDLTKGYGLMAPAGDVDFYPSGGIDQPGCEDELFAGILGLLTGGNGLQCSHARSHDLFIESINSACAFRAWPCSDWSTFERGECRTCPPDGCPVMGYDADQTSARGNFYLTTAPTIPYCGTKEYHVQIVMGSTAFGSTGRLNITLLGNHNSQEEEFSREYEQLHSNQTEHHVIAVNKLSGAVQGVQLRYHRRRGDNHVYVHRIIVEDLDTGIRVEFCSPDVEIVSDQPVRFTSRSGC